MNFHDLIARRLARRRQRRPRVKPKQPRAVEMFLLTAVLAMNRRAREIVLERVKSRVEAVARRDAARLDVTVKAPNVFQLPDPELSKLYSDDLDAALGETALKLNTFNARELSRLLGVDVSNDFAVGGVLAQFRREAAGYIRALPGEMLERVRNVLDDPDVGNLRVEEIQSRLADQFDIVDSHAALIARDQVLKTNGLLTAHRQQAAGVVEYTWSSSRDERVRPDHAALDGTTQHWGNPPIVDKRTGRRADPGGDFQCRCVAIPVLPDFAGDFDASDDGET